MQSDSATQKSVNYGTGSDSERVEVLSAQVLEFRRVGIRERRSGRYRSWFRIRVTLALQLQTASEPEVEIQLRSV